MTGTRRNGNGNSMGSYVHASSFVLLLATVFVTLTHTSLAENTETLQRVQQRNSYLDLWKNVFDSLDSDFVEKEVTNLEEHVERMDPGDEGTTKHRLMDVLEGRRKEKRSASLLKGLARQHGTITPNLPGRVFGGGGEGGKEGKGGVGVTFRQLGVPVENAVFESKLCFKMQNLGNADKYHGIIAGSPACDESSVAQTLASSMITWKGESAFLIDCSITSGVQNTTEGSVATIRAALSKGSYSESLPQAAVSSRASCSFSVVSDKAESPNATNDSDAVLNSAMHSHKPSAAMLKLADIPLPTERAIDVAPLNAVKVKLCDLSSAWSVGSTDEEENHVKDNGQEQETMEDRSDAPHVTLPTLKLNGKRLTSQELSSERGSACKTHTYRVPTVGLSNDGFVVSGSMVVREAHTLGAGRASGVEISFGSASLID